MNSKRRAGASSPPHTLQSGVKRRKVSSVTSVEETPQRTTEIGLELLSQIKQITDRNGRFVITEFLHLPDRQAHPDYYNAVKLPIAMETIEAKLKRFDYPTVTTLESDLRRLVSNAKSYNDKSSLIFADAERIRKMVVAAMPGINPAYKDPNYSPFPTPIPSLPSNSDIEAAGSVKAEEDASEAVSLTRRPPRHPRAVSVPEDNNQSKDDFEGATLQAAQDKIISELIQLKDSEGKHLAAPFVHKPDRNLYKDYYDVIQHPVSLRGIQKQVRGIEGRKLVHKDTAFSSWQAFEEEIEFVWRNAREFNEDGSEIVVLAAVLEDHFRRRVEEAKTSVPDLTLPPDDRTTPRLKLKMGVTKTPDMPSPKLTLRLSEQGDSTDGLEAHTRTGSAGQVGQGVKSSPSTRNTRRSAPSPLSINRRLMETEGKLGVASESPPEHSPITQSGHDTQADSADGSTAPDICEDSAELRRGGFGSPQRKGASSVTGLARSPKDHGRSWLWSNNVNAIYQSSNVSPLDLVLRHSKDDLSSPLISNVRISTHPTLNLGHGFEFDVTASASLTQQSVMINLPSSHNFISLHPRLRSAGAQKQTKLVAFLGSQRLHETAQPSSNTNSPLYDIRLNPGVTKVDFEMIAAPFRGIPKLGPPGSDIEYERLTVYFNLLH